MKSIKKILAIGVIMCVLICQSSVSLASYTSSLRVSAGGTSYTSSQNYPSGGTRHTTYYCKLNSVKYDNYSLNTFPSSGELYTRIYCGNNRAGEYAKWTASSIGNGSRKSYFSNYGYSGTNYRMASNSNLNLAYNCTITWDY